MKLKFKIQPFQTHAVNAIADLFKGQERTQSTFAADKNQDQFSFLNELGTGNAMLISRSQLQANMHAVQKLNALPLTELDNNTPQFSIEMETGTGKTYVYTKTIFELNKHYGFTKFIIVVPSVAIREGVKKSLEITAEHFGNIYNNTPCRSFIYNSSKLDDVKKFAINSNIEIMIITIDAFKKAENVINNPHEKFGDEVIMKYIQATNPIVIIDEPQSVDNTAKSKDAIASLNPLCIFRYSATHREKINLLYRLTPVDAYNKGLVKQICVSSNSIANDNNRAYVKLLSVSQDSGFKAKIEIDVKAKDGKVNRKIVTVKSGSDLYKLSGERELYEGYIVTQIDCTPIFESIEFANTEYVQINNAIGSVDENLLKEAQIRRTIEAHFNKELLYNDKGIKVLSLFFIDEVKKYRTQEREKGVYAQMFEKCYNELINKPKFSKIKEKYTHDVSDVHNGYFSQDKKGTFKDTRGDTQADDDTYKIIMERKEELLSFECPLRFIFSHSALKEGWDNPNVFQVCTLIDQKNTFTCRQKIGRGLRLCVDQDGNRIEDKKINILHVVANESFTEFADTLQKEIEDETGVKFGVVQLSMFSGITYTEEVYEEKIIDTDTATGIVKYMVNNGYILLDGKPTEKASAILENQSEILPTEIATIKENIVKAIEDDKAISADDIIGKSYTATNIVEKSFSYEDATDLISHLENNDYITKTGKITDNVKNAMESGTFTLPPKYEPVRNVVENIIKQTDTKPPLKNASNEVIVHLKKQVLLSPEFIEIWDKIKQKTTYRVDFNVNNLIEVCSKELAKMPAIPKARIIGQTADILIDNPAVTYREREYRLIDIENTYDVMPDILRIISEETLIKRSDVAKMIINSGRSNDFMNNPQAFLESALDIIRRNRHSVAIKGISYVKLDGQQYYAQEVFDSEEVIAYLDKNAIAVNNSVYDHVIYDSTTIEKPFAKALDDDPDVKLFFKIPDKFKIETPIGTYNPDWAVYLDKNGEEKLYFIIETKGTLDEFNRHEYENLKINCGKAHFSSLSNGIEMHEATNWKKFRVNS